jgi:hypothetical protein
MSSSFPYTPSEPPRPPMKSGSWIWRVVLVVIVAQVIATMVTVSVQAFTRYMRRSKTAEAIQQLRLIVSAAETARAESRGPRPFPPSAPRTPVNVPRGTPERDSPGAWDHPTWRALHFSMGAPHYFSYEFVSDGTGFTARALGDLDGDGVLSTFERACGVNLRNEVECSDGVWVHNELE